MALNVKKLIEKGVNIPAPETVFISQEVNLDRIDKDVVIYPGCRIYGEKTLILSGARLGYEGPVTVENCYIGQRVQLKSGFFKGSVFMDDVVMGYGAHVREGSILEEQASVAHSVALKQTILFPFVTLGSLINFCDCLMSGGTSRKNHSEVGSSYIHFNFTPNQDKATASLIGDVPRGVMLNQNPIFLGGQGGLVGPCRLEYGTLTAAGTICRKDELRPDRLIMGGSTRNANVQFTRGLHVSPKRVIMNNVYYIASLMALRQWYIHARAQFVDNDFSAGMLEGLREIIQLCIQERISRLMDYCRNLSVASVSSATQDHFQRQLSENCPKFPKTFLMLENWNGNTILRDACLEGIRSGIRSLGKNYISVIQGLTEKEKDQGTAWLQETVDHIVSETLKEFPFFSASNDIKQ